MHLTSRRRQVRALAGVAIMGLVAPVSVFVACLSHSLPLAALAIAFTAAFVVLWRQCERALADTLPAMDHGRLAPWRYPGSRLLAKPMDFVANSRVLQLLLEPLPVLEMRSDITEVIYVNYLVDADRLARFVPPGLDLQRLGPNGRYALFTFLTYHHGHFGFSFLGTLRRWLPSPFQTNWRVHVSDPRSGHRGIRFVTNAIDRAVPALAARMLSEGMPMHLISHASLRRDLDGTLHLTLDPGNGSAPDVHAVLRPMQAGDGSSVSPLWNEPWRSCFRDMNGFLEYCLPQDRAMDAQPWRHRVSRQEIHLGIPPESCVPLLGEVHSDAARAIVGDATPLCFLVPGVTFRFRVEAYDPLP